MAGTLPGPSVEKKRKTSGGTIFTLPILLPLVQKAISLPIASSALAILIYNTWWYQSHKCHCEGKGHNERQEYQ